jgi:DNA-binding response OmpR family regulator
MKFAIIESSRRQAEILKALLKSEGHQSEVFAEGRACLDVLDEAAFDFFIFDWGMLDISGSELLQEIRRRRGWQVPVVVSSALTSEENVSPMSCEPAPTTSFAKPIRYMEFMARIEALLRHSRPDNATTLRVGNIEIDLEHPENPARWRRCRTDPDANSISPRCS